MPRIESGSTPQMPTNKKRKNMIEDEVKALREQVDRIEGLLYTLVGEVQPGKKTDKKPWMNVREASEYFGLAETTLRLYCAQGKIDSSPFGKHLIVTTESVEAYLKSRMRKRVSKQADEQIKLIS